MASIPSGEKKNANKTVWLGVDVYAYSYSPDIASHYQNLILAYVYSFWYGMPWQR